MHISLKDGKGERERLLLLLLYRYDHYGKDQDVTSLSLRTGGGNYSDSTFLTFRQVCINNNCDLLPFIIPLSLFVFLLSPPLSLFFFRLKSSTS